MLLKPDSIDGLIKELRIIAEEEIEELGDGDLPDSLWDATFAGDVSNALSDLQKALRRIEKGDGDPKQIAKAALARRTLPS